MLATKDLEQYQLLGAKKAISKKRLLIFLKPGLGKTALTLKTISYLIKQGLVKKVLILAPIYVCETVWAQEAKQWAFSEGLTFTLLRGSPAHRIEKAKQDTDIYLLNYELLDSYCDKIHRLKRVESPQFDMVICDEVSKLASIKSKVYKTFIKYFKDTEYKLGLTGSPVGSNLLNVFGETTSIIGYNTALGANFYNFRDEFFLPIDYNQYTWKPKKSGQKDIFRAISNHCFSYTPKKCDHPSYYLLSYSLRNDQAQLIKEIARDGVIEEEILRAADISNKISQIESGFYYIKNEEGLKRTVHINSDKIEAVKSLISELEGDPLLIFYRYNEDLERLKKIGCKTKDTKHFINKWNNGNIQALAVHPASIGHGVNLHHGGHNILFYGLPWSLEFYRQCIGRLLRKGQTETVNVYMFDTPQERIIYNTLQDRGNVEQALMDYVNILKKDV